MQEFVGNCKGCNKQVYCNDGFINGIVLEDKSLLCFDCSEQEQIRGEQPSPNKR